LKTIGAKYSANLVEKEIKSKPGPGAYNPNASVTLKNSPNMRIGSATRDDLAFRKQIEFKPSPNVYNPRDSFTKT
jgi:Sperm-tail PG-rich repeat